jgi:hypothetical protein
MALIYLFSNRVCWCMGDQADFSSLKVSLSASSLILALEKNEVAENAVFMERRGEYQSKCRNVRAMSH